MQLKKSRKVYFQDNGVRNAIINNFNPLSLRNDIGALWENFIIGERRKYIEYHSIYAETWFWRTHAQQEIDYIEEREGKLYAYELKWDVNRKPAIPAKFLAAYPEHSYEVINPGNYLEFITREVYDPAFTPKRLT